MTSEAVVIQEASKRFADKQALDQVSFAVASGETFALVGANGAGKTTLIKAMLDFLSLDAGTITLFGVSSLATSARSRLAYLPERFLPPYFLSGQDFLNTMAQLHGLPVDQAAIIELFAALDLDSSALNKPVRSFSKGMTQKLGLAAVILSNKPLLVLDEPMSGLDPKARVLLKRRMAALKAAGRTLFFSTHMLADVEEICDRMAIVHQGRLHFLGSPAQCRAAFPGATLEESFIHCIEQPLVSV